MAPPTPHQQQEYLDKLDVERQLVRQLSLDDFWTYVTTCLWPKESEYHYQEDLHRPLCELVSTAEEGSRILILVPRKHRKSMLLNIAFCTWLILRDPNIRILIISALDAQAKRFLKVIKRMFQYNEGIKRYFPEFHVSPNTQFGTSYEFTHPLRTDHNLIDPTVRASYLGAPLAGSRCDVLISDDPIEKSHVTTPDQADKAVANFNDLIPLIDDTPGYDISIVLGTRWAFNDLFAALLGEDRGEHATVALEDKRRYHAVVRHALEDAQGKPDVEHGQPIFSKRFSKSTLLGMLDEYRNDPKQGEEDWWKQIMNICQSPKSQRFAPEWFDNWVPTLPKNIVWSGIAIDTATKDEQIIMQGDFTAAHVGHFDAYGHLYLTDAIHRDDLRSPELMRELVAKAQHHQVFNVVKEKVGEEMFFGMVREAYANANIPCTPYPCMLRGQGRKSVRTMEALQAPIMGGRVHFVGDPGRKTGYPLHIWQRLKDELVHLGQWSKDDLGDALSLFYHKDVRVRPTSFQSYEWKVSPSMRLPQAGARRTNPGFASKWATHGQPPTPPRDRFIGDVANVDLTFQSPKAK